MCNNWTEGHTCKSPINIGRGFGTRANERESMWSWNLIKIHVCWGMVLIMWNNVQYKLWNNKWSEGDENGLVKGIGNLQIIQSRSKCNPLCTRSRWSTLYVYHQYTVKLITGLATDGCRTPKVPMDAFSVLCSMGVRVLQEWMSGGFGFSTSLAELRFWNLNVGRKFLWQKIPLRKMGIVMPHNPNMAIEQLGQPMMLSKPSNIWSHGIDNVMFWVVSCINVLGHEGRCIIWKLFLKGNILEMMSNWQIPIGYEDNQIMTHSYDHWICRRTWVFLT